jgi:hypothetical protein
MKEGPSRPAVSCRCQATASGCRQERWWCCVKKLRELDLTYLIIWSRVLFCLATARTELSQTPMSRSFLWNVLPRLRTGIIVHFHDIFWPPDYLRERADQYYSEQYLLGS